MVTTAPLPVPGTHVGVELQHEIEQFLYFEARLLDDRRFDEWWQLFTDDIHYWMPARYNRQPRELHLETGAPGELATFDDDKLSLYQRIYRLSQATAWAEQPPSRTRHLVANVWARPTRDGGEIGEELDVQSVFVVHRNRGDYGVDVWSGRRDDVLRRTDGCWQIARRSILIDESTILSPGISTFF